MLSQNKLKVLLALKKTKGQLERLEQLVNDDISCPEVMRQILACIGYLESAQKNVLKSHLKTCGISNLSSKDEKIKDKFIEDIIQNLGMAK